MRSLYKVNVIISCWFVCLCTALVFTSCAMRRAIPIEKQNVDSSYQYSVPPQEKDGWQTRSLGDAGISLRPLSLMVSRIRDNTYQRVHSVLLIKDGKLVFEEYFDGRHRYQAHPMHSVSKSVTSILVGIAVDKGLISVNDPVFGYFNDYHGLEWIDKPYDITIKDLLTMAHGTDWDERSLPLSNPRNSIRAMTNSKDWIHFILDHKLVEPPGARFNYAGGMTVLLGEIVSRASGLDLDGFAKRYLFQPMGIYIEGWHRSRLGVVNCQGGLLLRPRDMAKIGQMMLDKGIWMGNRIISEAWVDASLQNLVTAEAGWGYGYQWRLGQALVDDRLIDLFFAAGRGGQHIIVVPSLRLVAVFTTQPIGNKNGANRNLMMMSDYILPAVTGVTPAHPLREDVDDLDRYTGRYLHQDSGDKVSVVREGSSLSIWPYFWYRISMRPINPDTFVGYSNWFGRLHTRFLLGNNPEEDKIVARFLFGKRIYERIDNN